VCFFVFFVELVKCRRVEVGLNLGIQKYYKAKNEFNCMHFGVIILGSVTILLGILLMIYGSRSRGEMDSDLGKIKSSIWFLAIIIGISTTVIGFLLT
jgi:uncharacterized membrane protein YozB (DUF420 family)